MRRILARNTILLVAAVALCVFVLLPGAGIAGAKKSGSDEKKCTYPTQECLDHMAQKMKNAGWVGVEMETDDDGHYVIQKVVPGSPAEASGIKPGDVLYALNGVELIEANNEKLAAARKDWKPGQSVTYTIRRGGSDRQVTLTLAPMPADVLAKWIGQHMLEHANVAVASAK